MNEIREDMVNQTNLFKEIEQSVLNQAKLELKRYFEQKDLEIKNSNWRLKEGWIIHDNNIKRTQITEFGDVTFKHTKYKNKNTGKYAFLVDPFLQIQKYSRVVYDLKMKIINSFEGGERQKDIIRFFKNANFNRQTVSNILQSINSQDLAKHIENNNKVIESDNDIVYIDIDDCWSTIRNKYKKEEIRIRVAVAYETRERNNKKYELKNKRAFVKTFSKGKKCDTHDYSKYLLQMLETNYGDLSKKQIILCGDGANWIKEIADYIGAEYILDKFHLFQKIYRCFAYKKSSKSKNSDRLKDLYQKTIEYYSENKINELVQFLTTCLDMEKLNIQRIKEAIRYITNNRKGIENHFKSWNNGCHAEAAVSHLIKSTKGYGAKIYSKNNFEILINIKIAKINGINLVNFLTNKLKDKLQETISDQYFDNSNNDNKNTNKNRKLKEINLPILDKPSTIYSTRIRNLNNS
ncbi:Mbov_0401 family ICE element transposase-like protein [Spiroplasma endosymbiont of Cantharis lateralis]|uniref:Mbov_0401 family ICE element transposase-like protein n=1 Tax=Spiroplasma endosymbiont of Cantharis lateralis TaxID=3066277 RepID=UPI00313B93F5